MRGYYGIGIYNSKTEANIGTLWRSAYCFKASFIFTIGQRYKRQTSDTTKTPRHIPLLNYIDFDDFRNHIPFDCRIVCIENDDKAISIKNYIHPERCIYLLGSEDSGLPNDILTIYKEHIMIETPECLNVATAGSIVMFDRINKNGK